MGAVIGAAARARIRTVVGDGGNGGQLQKLSVMKVMAVGMIGSRPENDT